MSSNKERLQDEICESGAWTPVPNWVFDEVLGDIWLADSVLKAFLFLYRKTIGWNNVAEEKSLTQIMEGAGIRSRNTAIHAVSVLCECWGLWKKTRGVRGEHSSIFEPAAVMRVDQFRERSTQTLYIYDTTCPTLDQLRDLPPAAHLYAGVKSLMESNRPGIEKQKLIRQFVENHRLQGQQDRSDRAKEKKALVQARKASSVKRQRLETGAMNALPSAIDAPSVVQ